MDKEFYVEGLMDLTPYRLARGQSDKSWNSFVLHSPQGSIFANSVFLNALEEPLGLWYLLKHDTPTAAVVLHERRDGRSGMRPPMAIYNGIMLAPPPPEQGPAQTHSEQFRTTCALIQKLTERYDQLELFCTPEFTDIRPFQWHNYGLDAPHFTCRVLYTSLLDIGGADAPLDHNPTHARANKSRRQEVRYAIKAGVTVEETLDIDLFKRMYEETFLQQGMEVNLDDLQRLRRLLPALHQAGMLSMFVARLADGTPGSIAVFGLHGTRAYYLFGANAEVGRDGHCGTHVLWSAFQTLSARGIREVDLEGVNSPKRGYFKLSFGGSLTPYYQLSYPAII